MKRFLFFALLFAFFSANIFCQDDYEDEDEQSDEFLFEANLNMPGDQCIRISLGGVFPLNFPNLKSLFIKDMHQIKIGGMGTLGYRYFLTSRLAVGFDAGFGFNKTIGSHIFNYVPLLAVVTFQPTWKKLEFPLSFGIGGAWESCSGKNYFPGLVLKPEAGVHYRIAPSWSLGIEVAYSWMPQFNSVYKNGKNYFGQFFDLAVVARYIF